MMVNLVSLAYLLALTILIEGTELSFPPHFKFGIGSAAYQIEGGWNASHKGESIWDKVTHERPNWVKNNQTADKTCDSYHLWKTDVQLLKNLSVHFYSFSLSWPRLLPNGFSNRINQDGVDYYNKLINELLASGIEPLVTLYHGDLPQPLQDVGGWANSVLATYFENYAKIAFGLFGDRVKKWITFNDPSGICVSGQHTPGINVPGISDYLCSHTVLLAHAKAYQFYNNNYRRKQKGKIGIAINSKWYQPKSNSTEDELAARRALEMTLGWWGNPIWGNYGDFPQIMKERVKNMSQIQNFTTSRLPTLSRNDIRTIRRSADFLGLNHYSSAVVSNVPIPKNATTTMSYFTDISIKEEYNATWNSSAVIWLKSAPCEFRKLLNWIKRTYNNPVVYVTGNGFADLGELNDTNRINYHKGYLVALHRAIVNDRCNVKAYSAWSLLDSFEWRDGYTIKCGFYHVNFTDPLRARKPKASVTFYKNLIQSRQISDGLIQNSAGKTN